MMSQKPETRAIVRRSNAEAREQKSDAAQRFGRVRPLPEYVLSRLLPKYLEFTIYSAMLETNASFFAAQLVAMSNASDNAKKLIDELDHHDEQRPPSRNHQRNLGNRRRSRGFGGMMGGGMVFGGGDARDFPSMAKRYLQKIRSRPPGYANLFDTPPPNTIPPPITARWVDRRHASRRPCDAAGAYWVK